MYHGPPAPASMTPRQQLGLFLTMVCLYLVVGSREPPWNDARQIHEVAESIVERGSIAVRTPTALQHGGKSYALHPLLPSLIHLPGALAARVMKATWPDDAWTIRAMTSHLGPALLGALACLLFAQLCLDLGVSRATASLAGLLLGCGTMVAVYARVPWSEITQTATFVGAFLWLLRASRTPGPRAGLWLGLWLGLLVNAKAVFALSLPGAALFAGITIGRAHGRAAAWRTLGAAALAGLPWALLFLWYDHARTGSLLDTGYALPGQVGRAYDEALLTGLYGLFVSIGKGLFLYNPPLIASALALPHALRTRPRAWLWALLLTAGPVVLLYAHSSFWSGDWCWGPRYLLFLVPIALLPLVFAFDDTRAARRRLALGLGGAALGAGLAIQLLGIAFYWDPYIQVAQEARLRWLGTPDRSGAIAPDRGGACDPCFEDFYQHQWLPAFTPIAGHLWLLRHNLPGRHHDPWDVAEADAPWHRYTKLQLDIAASYRRVHLDWWLYDFNGHLRRIGLVLFAAMVLALGASAVFWWRSTRAVYPPRP
jgi:hypothetical protein